MEKWYSMEWEESFVIFERAAAKGHEESIWIGNVVKDVEMEENALREAFVKTDEPLGWWFVGMLSSEMRESHECYKKSAEGGCSWGQVQYAQYFEIGDVVEQDDKVSEEWLEKAANQRNPQAMVVLSDRCRNTDEGGVKKALSYCRAAVELGWESPMDSLAEMLRDGEGCAKDSRQAVIWSAKGEYSTVFWELLEEAHGVFESGATEKLDCEINQLCYSLGWGGYWYLYGSEDWIEQDDEDRAFGERCMDFYSSCVELQQKSIFTFLLCWNRTTGGVKGPGQMIAQMVWEGQEENLVGEFEQSDGEESETKRIKK
jgi:TPR repeat protein